MRNLIILVVIFAIVGLIVGYLIFGRVEATNKLIPIDRLFAVGDSGPIDALVSEFRADKRQSIYISGAVGAGVGLLLGLVISRKRK